MRLFSESSFFIADDSSPETAPVPAPLPLLPFSSLSLRLPAVFAPIPASVSVSVPTEVAAFFALLVLAEAVLGAPALRRAGAHLHAHHQRRARGQPGGARLHLQAPRHHRVGVSADRPGAGAVEPARPAAPRAGNMLDYARRELETFSRRGLCAVDSLILS